MRSLVFKIKTVLIAGALAVTGCGATTGAPAQTTATPPATPDLVTECQIINYPQPNLTALDSAEADNFNGPGQSTLLNASADDIAPVYRVTLNNDSGVPVTVNSTDTVLFDGTSELTSDSENIGQLISPGASLTFTFPVPSQLVTSQSDDWGNPTDYETGANFCLVEGWS